MAQSIKLKIEGFDKLIQEYETELDDKDKTISSLKALLENSSKDKLTKV
jgi:archaellum component FlaC